MIFLSKFGGTTNTPTKEFMVETQEDLVQIKEKANFGDIAVLIDDDDVLFYILNSKKEWIQVE